MQHRIWRRFHSLSFHNDFAVSRLRGYQNIFPNCMMFSCYQKKYKNEPDAVLFLLKNKLKMNIRYSLIVTDRTEMHNEFNSLMSVFNFIMANLLSAEGSPLKVCKHCNKAFISENKRTEFCSERCRNQFNVYKSRAKTKRNK